MATAKHKGLGFGVALLATIALGSGCTREEPAHDSLVSSANELTVSRARNRVEELRARFRTMPPAAESLKALGPEANSRPEPALKMGVAKAFEPTDRDSVRPVISGEARRGVVHTASVELPMHANGMARIEDDATHVSVGFALRGAADAPIVSTDGIALYAGALAGSDVLQRAHAAGTEDFVVFEERPALEAIAYDVDVSRVPGLRLVGNTLEFLDEGGAPRLRVAPPYVVDANGARTEAKLTLEGCAFDASPVAPWGRPITPPGAKSCTVGVSWAIAAYPAIVDPSWVATGFMITQRYEHTATLLSNGQVLIAGGTYLGVYPLGGELYDAATGTFGATGNLVAPTAGHTATLLGTNKVLIAAGADAMATLSTAQLYNPVAGTFAATGSLSAARYAHTATLLTSGKVLVVGGLANPCCATVLASTELYDPATGMFTGGATKKSASAGHVAALLPSGKVLVAGGEDAAYMTTAEAEIYDPAGAGSFTVTAGAMTVARKNHTATTLGSGKVLLIGGLDNSAELFDPGTGKFAATGSLALARAYPTATLLPSGKVLIVGGLAPAVASTEMYDPSSGTFASAGSLVTARRNQAAVLLKAGQVLVAGGVDVNNNVTGTAELFELLPGAVCVSASDCASGVCEDGICCGGACSGTCKTCTPGTGACVSVTNADDPDTCSGASTCDASGSCKNKVGQACPGGSGDCANNQCVDGYCCATACSGSCDACNLPGKLGTCSPLPAGNPGSPVCGNGLACDGMSVACPASCSSDIDCLASDYCSANAMCQPRKAQGASCNAGAGADCNVAGCRDCASGNCVDGVCCNTACNTLCQACTAALKESGANDGVCDSAKAQTNPHNDPCPTSDPSTCGADGLCSGAGACSLYYPAGTSCGASMCVAGNKVAGELCDGSGTCAANPNGVACGQFLCANASCPATCIADGDCIATAYCNQGTCVAKASAGASCSSGNQCSSTFCADGVCCNSDCTGQCEACNVGATKGTCTPVVGAPAPPRAACPAGDAQHPCAATECDGQTTTSCAGFVGSSTACRAEACAGGTQTLEANCDGKGNCPAAVTKLCAPYTCGATSCDSSCTVDKDCVGGTRCVDKKCVSGATCSADGHSVESAGMTKDCAPYVCAGGACIETCNSVDDCAAPNVCDASHHCGPQAASTSGAGGPESGGGCAIGARRDDASSSGSLLLLAFAVLGLRRRRAPPV